MSSLIRRIERQVVDSQPVHWNEKTKRHETADPRAKFYGGRGSKLGVVNPKDPCRMKRDRRAKAIAMLRGLTITAPERAAKGES